MKYAKNEIVTKSNEIINYSLNNMLINNDFDDMIIIEKDINGIIEEISFNNVKANKILYYSTNNIMEKIKTTQLDSNNMDNLYYVPFGVIFNNSILSNLGPSIPFKTKMIGSTDNRIDIMMKEYGINSFLVQLILSIDINLEIILPFTKDIVNIQKEIILDSKIIQGQIPKYYGGINRE